MQGKDHRLHTQATPCIAAEREIAGTLATRNGREEFYSVSDPWESINGTNMGAWGHESRLRAMGLIAVPTDHSHECVEKRSFFEVGHTSMSRQDKSVSKLYMSAGTAVTRGAASPLGLLYRWIKLSGEQQYRIMAGHAN